MRLMQRKLTRARRLSRRSIKQMSHRGSLIALPCHIVGPNHASPESTTVWRTAKV